MRRFVLLTELEKQHRPSSYGLVSHTAEKDCPMLKYSHGERVYFDSRLQPLLWNNDKKRPVGICQSCVQQ